jgi:hypothetical protein
MSKTDEYRQFADDCIVWRGHLSRALFTTLPKNRTNGLFENASVRLM